MKSVISGGIAGSILFWVGVFVLVARRTAINCLMFEYPSACDRARVYL